MKILTAEQINYKTELFEGKENTRRINTIFRAQEGDVERADRIINKVRVDFRSRGEVCQGLPYILALEAESSRRANSFTN